MFWEHNCNGKFWPFYSMFIMWFRWLSLGLFCIDPFFFTSSQLLRIYVQTTSNNFNFESSSVLLRVLHISPGSLDFWLQWNTWGFETRKTIHDCSTVQIFSQAHLIFLKHCNIHNGVEVLKKLQTNYVHSNGIASFKAKMKMSIPDTVMSTQAPNQQLPHHPRPKWNTENPL